jgi:hypothetical protein
MRGGIKKPLASWPDVEFLRHINLACPTVKSDSPRDWANCADGVVREPTLGGPKLERSGRRTAPPETSWAS